jgi:replicative DNA helicase
VYPSREISGPFSTVLDSLKVRCSRFPHISIPNLVVDSCEGQLNQLFAGLSEIGQEKAVIAKGFKMLGFNPLNHPICLTHPSRVAIWTGEFFHASAWIGHVPFGMYLIDVLRPKVLAELGTHYGASYCGFCQAVKELGLDTRCYAIDTWEGDAQSGFYGPQVLSNLEQHHNPRYSTFSRLIQSTFDEALNYFADDTFDLLHVDGYHSYEAVKADFAKWLPKMTDRGIVLFHDINVRERDFGVWRFWSEVKLQYPSFEFSHAHGLGVLAVGHDYPEELNALLHCSEAEAISLRRFFSNLGSRLEAAQELENVKPELETLKAQMVGMVNDSRAASGHIEALVTNERALSTKIQTMDLDAQGLIAQIQTLEGQTQALNGQIQIMEAQTQALNALLQGESTQRFALFAQLEARDALLDQKALELMALNSQLADVQRQKSEQDGLIRGQDLQLLSANNQAEANQHELRNQAQQIQDQAQQIQTQTQQIAQLKRDLKDREVNLQSAAWKIRSGEQRMQELSNMLAGIEDMRNTGSYRLVRALSAPLRWKYRMTLKRYLQSVKHLGNKQEPSLKPQAPATIPRLEDFAKKEIVKSEVPTIEAAPSEPVFDAEWYMRESAWLTTNMSSGETALFDSEWYLRKNPDVAAANMDPLLHYLRFGADEGRAPHPLFDSKFYLRTYPEAALGGGNALRHYLNEGWTKGYKPNPKFDPAFYLAMYPDIAEAEIEPLTHFVTNGLREGRSACLEDVYFDPFEAAFEISREPSPDTTSVATDVKAIAFYLPQYHPIPENDKWWGKGFTEWTNVRKGQPLFKDHYQPHVPSELDYYDLRETHVLERQVELAQQYGIYGFCFYYYWFVGKILLDLPIRRMLERGEPDFPFCICWANENWTRRWDGQDDDILIGQQHSPEDDLAFFKNIERILLHKNYIRVDGKPLLIVYQPRLLPDALATAMRWREAFRSRGHGEIFLAATQTFKHKTPPQEYGFDAVIQFPPHTNSGHILGLAQGLDPTFSGRIYDYNQTKWSFIDEFHQLSKSRLIYPGVMPSWDNTARRGKKSSIWIRSSPESYCDWLDQVASYLRQTRPHEEKLVFINAWNEWAEGCHLEPDRAFGYAWLNATKLALQSKGNLG